MNYQPKFLGGYLPEKEAIQIVDMVDDEEVNKFKDPGNSHYNQKLQRQNLLWNFHFQICFEKLTICSLFSLLMCALDAASQLWFLALFPLENARLEDHDRKIIFCLITCLLLFLRTLSVPSVSASLPVSGCGWSPKRRRGWRGKQPEMILNERQQGKEP